MKLIALLAVFLSLSRAGEEPPEPALHMAAIRGNVRLVARLLDQGAPVETRNARLQTALFVACGQHPRQARAQAKVATLLLGRGATVDAADAQGGTPLHAAAARGALPLVKLLLEKGADPSHADKNGMTPLMWAAAVEDGEKLVAALLEKGADASAVNKDGLGALAIARANGNAASVALLSARTAREAAPPGDRPR